MSEILGFLLRFVKSLMYVLLFPFRSLVLSWVCVTGFCFISVGRNDG